MTEQPTDDPDAETLLPSRAMVTVVLQSMGRGDPQASDRLLGLVYDELRQLARARIAKEPRRGAGMTLEATALVHEAYLRVVGRDTPGPAERPQWNGRGHFFGAAALAMRRILVERARYRQSVRHGGGRSREPFRDDLPVAAEPSSEGTDLIALDRALNKLEQSDPRKARVVSLRFFTGLTVDETAAAMDLSPATVKNDWAFARAWLHRELNRDLTALDRHAIDEAD